MKNTKIKTFKTERFIKRNNLNKSKFDVVELVHRMNQGLVEVNSSKLIAVNQSYEEVCKYFVEN